MSYSISTLAGSIKPCRTLTSAEFDRPGSERRFIFQSAARMSARVNVRI
jgi:hypothetical protein